MYFIILYIVAYNTVCYVAYNTVHVVYNTIYVANETAYVVLLVDKYNSYVLSVEMFVILAYKHFEKQSRFEAS